MLNNRRLFMLSELLLNFIIKIVFNIGCLLMITLCTEQFFLVFKIEHGLTTNAQLDIDKKCCKFGNFYLKVIIFPVIVNYFSYHVNSIPIYD